VNPSRHNGNDNSRESVKVPGPGPQPSLNPQNGFNQYLNSQPGDPATENYDQLYFDGRLPLSVLRATVRVYFTHCHNQPYSFFHEANLLQQLSDGDIPDYLLFALLSNAVRFSDHPFFQGVRNEAAINFATRSWKAVVSTCFASNQKADIRTVQTITLLAIFDFTGSFLASLLPPASSSPLQVQAN